MRRILIILGVIVIGVGIGVLIFWLVTRGGENHLRAGVEYRLYEIRPNTFFDAGGDVIDAFSVDPGNSFLVFDEDFEIMTAYFDGQYYRFSIIRVRERRRSVTIDMVGLIGGRIAQMRLVADSDRIVIRATKEHTVLIETEDDRGDNREVIQQNDILLVFRIPTEVTP